MNKPILIDKQSEKAEMQLRDISKGLQNANNILQYRNSIKELEPILIEKKAREFISSPLSYTYNELQKTLSPNPKFPDDIEAIFERRKSLNKKEIYNALSGGVMTMSEMNFANGRFTLPVEKENEIRESYKVYAISENEIKRVKSIEQLCHSINDHRNFLGLRHDQTELFLMQSKYMIEVENTSNGFIVKPNKAKLIQWLANNKQVA